MQAVDYHRFINRSLPLPERSCTSKAVFISRAEARALLRHGRHGGAGLRPYHCRYCGAWHLGHTRRH